MRISDWSSDVCSSDLKYSQNSWTSNDVPRNTSIKKIDTPLASQLREILPTPKANAKTAQSTVEKMVNCIVTHPPSSTGVPSLVKSISHFLDQLAMRGSSDNERPGV